MAIAVDGSAGSVPPDLREWPKRSLPFMVRPPGEPTAIGRIHPLMEDLVRRTLRFDGAGAIKLYEWQTDVGMQEGFDVTLMRESSEPWPLAGCFDVWIRIGGREHLLGKAVFPKGSRNYSASVDMLVPDGVDPDRPGQVDVILRPSAEAAEGTPDVFEFWDGEVVWEDVAVNRW